MAASDGLVQIKGRLKVALRNARPEKATNINPESYENVKSDRRRGLRGEETSETTRW